MKFFLLYLVVINIIASVITMIDKRAAEMNRWRISERALMLVAALGGGLLMLLTMLVIRHKTRKPLFMIGIPLIIVLELALVIVGGHYVLHIF